MANETTTSTLTELIYAETIEKAILDALRAAFVVAPTFRYKDISAENTGTASFPKWPTVAAAAVTETQDLTNTAIDTTDANATVSEIGVMTTLTDHAKENSLRDPSEFARIMALGLKDKIDVDGAALYTALNGATHVGNVATDMSMANFLSAIQTLQANNALMPFVSVLHPVQAGHFRTSIMSSTGTPLSNVTPEEFGVKGNGYVGNIFGVDVYQSSNVDSHSTNSSYLGAMYSKGYALGLINKRAVRVETQRDASARATEIVVTSRYAVLEIQDKAGVCIESDT